MFQPVCRRMTLNLENESKNTKHTQPEKKSMLPFKVQAGSMPLPAVKLFYQKIVCVFRPCALSDGLKIWPFLEPPDRFAWVSLFSEDADEASGA